MFNTPVARKKLYLRVSAFLTALVCLALAATLRVLPQEGAKPARPSAREDAYRANNIGVAYMDQFNYKDAADNFKRALALDPQSSIARLNLGIALYNLPDVNASLVEIKKAAELLPDSPQPHYMLGIIAKSQNRPEDAIKSFQRVLQIDPRDVGANVNVAQLLMQQRKYADALPLVRVAVESEPYNVTATYNLAIALLRSGQREEGQQFIEKFNALRDSNYGVVIGQNYLEQGRYAEAIASTGAEAELVNTSTPEVKYVDATSGILPQSSVQQQQGAASAFGRSFNPADLTEAAKRELVSSFGGGLALFDYDGDGDLDLFEAGPASRKLYRNDGGKFTDVTEASGLASAPRNLVATGAVAGDFDNDGRADLFVFGYGALALYHNDGNGKFSDVTTTASIPAYTHLALSAAFVDIDHDGDLDIFITGFADLSKTTASADAAQIVFPDDFPAAPNLLLRNNGNGKFSDITAEAKLAGGSGRALAIVPTDYDNRRDIDLMILNYGAAPTLFRNLRDGTFQDVASEMGMGVKGNFVSLAAGDVNKDGFTDFFLGKAGEAGIFAMSDGKGRFVTNDAPAGTERANAAQFIDYDNDGLLDLVTLSSNGFRVLRNLGNRWSDVTENAAPRETSTAQLPARSFVSGDIDGDGDADLIARLASGELKAARNEGGTRNSSLRVQLAAKVSNRSSVATKVEVRAGSLRQKLETYSASPAPAPADLIFGLGSRASVDAVRVLWPAGIVQAEIEVAKAAKAGEPFAAKLTITELDRKPSSCPYLYAWNGERFEFITDFMGGGEMGYLLAPGVYNHPDPDEYVRIRGDQLRERDGRYELRVTNELEEALFVDRLQLIAVAHPEDTEVFPNEGMIPAPLPPFKLYVARDARPPASATDDHGHDVQDRLKHIDRKFPDDFQLHRIRGYAEEHTLTLDLGPHESNRTLLLLTGWTDYAFSSDNLAAHQAGLRMKPPALQVKDESGGWKTVIENIGIPVGRPQTIPVDLTGKFLSASREVRLVTNMRIYWDQALVATSDESAPARMTRLELRAAELRWRGFSAETTPDGREPFGYDYSRVSSVSPWKVMPGRYTREGDVRELLLKTDDMFVISRPGDEIAISFDARRLPPLPRGWKRTFLLYSDGYSKEMDINSATPDAVLPLPFHGMKSYPYQLPEAYPITRARRDYMERYNTRVVTRPVLPVEVDIVEARAAGQAPAGRGTSR
ncbi:MAG: FG-GAP-like repeat-containing protein [Blastocatellia bacterium]|nr:FG-GAP-like repeat-containing protein [Blastocatellia bacterium]